MITLDEKPPQWIFDACATSFRIDPGHTVWTYGDTIYAPGLGTLPPDVVAHEETHMRQQGDDPDAWWKRYLIEPRFRLEQEAEAYATQYAYYCKRVADRNARARYLHRLTAILASSLYKVALTQKQARAMIEVLAGQRKFQPA